MGRYGLQGWGLAAYAVVITTGCVSEPPTSKRAVGEACGPAEPCVEEAVCFDGFCRVPCIVASDCDVSNEHCGDGVCVPGRTRACGNGIVETAEECDDGGLDADDGCDGTCAVEAGFSCSSSPSVCTRFCPNGVIDAGEECDDNNSTITDGCVQCLIETGWGCVGEPSVCSVIICGDSILQPAEECDDGGQATGDGCDDRCLIEPGYGCSGLPSVCTPTTCGDNRIDSTEDCDDGGGSPGDGCDASCALENGWDCTIGPPTICTSVCGDGIMVGSEGCDDGDNIIHDACPDGASATCITAACGDGYVWYLDGGNESCDHAGVGAGCAANCRTWPGWNCLGDPSICSCAVGFQDLDANGTCQPTCAELGWISCGGFGDCVQTSGVAICQCNADYQDNDADGTCELGCASAPCATGTCSDAGGTVVCDCPGSSGSFCDRCITHVDPAVAGGDGSSWLAAFSDLDLALVAAESSGCDLWLRAGIYPVFRSAATDTVTLRPNMRIYGGFAGTETRLTERDIAANTTVLDGGTWPQRVETVVTGAPGAELDGLTIRNGFGADGGGLNTGVGALAVRNCVFEANETSATGGAISVPVGGILSVSATTFVGNRSARGGAIQSAGSVTCTDCTFDDNQATLFGGAIHSDGGEVTIAASRLTRNQAVLSGGALYVTNGAIVAIDESTFATNRVDDAGEGGAIWAFSATVDVARSTFVANEAIGLLAFGGALRVNDTTLTLVQTVLASNLTGGRGGAISGLAGSGVTLENCLFVGNEALRGADLHADQSSVSLTHVTIDHSGGTTSAVDFWGANATITNSIIVFPAGATAIEEGGTAASVVNVGYSNAPETPCAWSGCNIDTATMAYASAGFVPVTAVGGDALSNATYDAVSGETELTDTAQSWLTDALVGQTLVIDSAPRLAFPVVGNTATTIRVPGDLTFLSVSSTGAPYSFSRYELAGWSVCVDAAEERGVTRDLAGRWRERVRTSPASGVAGATSYPDMGANEHSQWE